MFIAQPGIKMALFVCREKYPNLASWSTLCLQDMEPSPQPPRYIYHHRRTDWYRLAGN